MKRVHRTASNRIVVGTVTLFANESSGALVGGSTIYESRVYESTDEVGAGIGAAFQYDLVGCWLRTLVVSLLGRQKVRGGSL